MPLLGWDILHRLGTKITLGGTLTSTSLQTFLLLEKPRALPNSENWEAHINPIAWDQGTPRQAKSAIPIVINFKNPSYFPNRKQYPLRPEAKQGLQPMLSKFLQHEFLVPTNSPYNTPILPVKRKDKT